MSRMKWHCSFAAALIALSAIWLDGCAPRGADVLSVDLSEDLRLEIEFHGKRAAKDMQSLGISTESLVERIELVDPVEGDVLGRLNDSEVGELVPAGPVADTLSDLLSYSGQCFGAFDPTLQILWDVYDFELGGRRVRQGEVEDALTWVDYSLVEMDGDSILRKREHVRAGFGPTLPGAVVDWVAQMVERNELSGVSVAVNGSFNYLGERGNESHVYELRYPIDAESADVLQLTLGHLRLEPGEYLAALDDDEKRFIAGGEMQHMILDPISGRPVRSVRAALVVSKESCLQASVFAYAVMVMGPDRGLEFLDEMDGVEGLLVTEEHDVRVSGGLGDRFWR